MTEQEAIEILKENRPTYDPRLCGQELCEAVDVAINALKQAEKYKRHDLSMNPDDLPEINRVVICECKSDYGTTAYFVMQHTGERWLWQNRVPMFKIIAWKYIEPF